MTCNLLLTDEKGFVRKRRWRAILSRGGTVLGGREELSMFGVQQLICCGWCVVCGMLDG